MAFRFTDAHALSLVQPHLFPGEQLLHRSRGVERPTWTILFPKIGAFFHKFYLVVATNQRLLLVRHGGLFSGYGAKDVQAITWGELKDMKLGWGIFETKLHGSSSARRLKKSIAIPRFWMKNNLRSGEGMVQAWRTAANALPPASQAGYYPSLNPAS
jgi:hypothetical protein